MGDLRVPRECEDPIDRIMEIMRILSVQRDHAIRQSLLCELKPLLKENPGWRNDFPSDVLSEMDLL
ncbi:MAG: hypothetical protein WCT46_04700 [Candidatus Gracilibacteria bacterium]|jgi:hypothetical protein